MSLTLADIQAAAAAIEGQVERTPLTHSRTLSALTGAEIWLKCENLQFTAAFKERGALNCMLHLTPAQKAAGVITMSAGNHAQAVAYHAYRLGIAATIVMPRHTPLVKVTQTEGHGAKVVLEGDDLAAAAAHAHALEQEQGLYFIHPYDDEFVIAGQGTIALEILAERGDFDAMIVPIGGGGLISGIAIAAKALKPDIEIVGVQAAEYPFMLELLSGHVPSAPNGRATIAEGIAVKDVGALTLPVIRALVDEIVLASENQLERAVSLMVAVEKLVTEGAGAAALAALLAHPERFRNRRLCLIVSGGNIDQRLLASVLVRDLMRSGRLIRLFIPVRDVPGELARVAIEVAKAGANILEVTHQRLMFDLSAKEAEIDLLIETRNDEQAQQVLTCLRAAGFAVHLATDKEPVRL